MNWILLVEFPMKSSLKGLKNQLELIKKYVKLKDFLLQVMTIKINVLIWSILMEGEFMSKTKILPEIIVFPGSNGSGKTTITRMAKTVGVYINVDDIKRSSLCSDLEAALKAEELREYMLKKAEDFTFETVLSTDRNLKLLKKAKKIGFFIRCIYVLISDYNINMARVRMMELMGGYSVPEDKIKSRFFKALDLIPELVEICDVVHI